MGGERQASDLALIAELEALDATAGEHVAGELSLVWSVAAGIQATRSRGPVKLEEVTLDASRMASVQLSKGVERQSPHWLMRVLGRDRPRESVWLQAQFRGARGERMRLLTKPPHPLGDLVEQPLEGQEVPWHLHTTITDTFYPSEIMRQVRIRTTRGGRLVRGMVHHLDAAG